MRPQDHIEISGPLSGHVREGRRFSSTLAATGVLNIADWARDDLPDLVWPALTLSRLGNQHARNYVRWQGAVQRDLGTALEPKLLADGVDGRLTSLDRLVERLPGAKEVIRDRIQEFDLLPTPVAKVLASYPERPAAWIVDLEFAPPTRDEVDLLAQAISEALRDGHREAIIKCLSIWSAVQAGTFRSDAQTVDLLKSYPNDPTMRSKADTVIRASWGALKSVELVRDETRFDASVKWARVFWGINSMTTRCLRRRDLEDHPSDDEDLALDVGPGVTPEGGDHLRQLAMDLLSSYAEALETAPARLYDQEQQEVHAGLVFRAGREIVTALGAPDLWSMEHGAHVIRTLVEIRVYIQWMALQESTIYRQFQEYGAGKAKLYARITDEIPQDWLLSDATDAIKELDRLSHNDDILDHRVVDTSDSFAGGKSLRSMAEECGLLNLYRHAYYMASGVSHSEWWSVETHCMERCLNILHRGHLIPSLSLSAGGNVQLASSWVDALYALIRASLNILGTDHEAVTQAFSWLSSKDDQEE